MSLDLSSTILDLIKSVNDVTETFVSRNGSSMYGSLSPYNNKGASLGTSSKQWNTIYGGTIYENGTSLSNKYGVTVTQKLTSGTEIGSIKVGSTTTKLYAPTASVSGNYLPLSGGTMTGDIKFNTGTDDYTKQIGTENGLAYIDFEGKTGSLSLNASGLVGINAESVEIYAGQSDNSITVDQGGVTLWSRNGVISATAPANVSGQEKVTAWFNTANGGRVGFGKEATNSGTGIFFDQVKGTRRLNFCASSTAGEMVWEQPEANSGLYFDVNNVFFREANNVQFTKLQSAGYLYTDSSGYLKKGTLATQNAAGLMSAADKTKLDGIGANTIKSLSASGTTITYTKGDGTKGAITTQDTKVKQTHTSDNRPFSLALLPTNSSSEITDQVYKNTGIFAIPYIGALVAKSFYENNTALSDKYHPKKRKVTLAELRTAMQTMATGTRIQVVPYGIDDNILYSVGACITYSTTNGGAYNSQASIVYDGTYMSYYNWDINIHSTYAKAIYRNYSIDGSSIYVDEEYTENLTDDNTDFYILD